MNSRHKLQLEVQFERYSNLVDRDNCFFLNQTVRDTLRILEFLSVTRYEPVHTDDVALFTGLSEGFVAECLTTLAFDGFIRETDLGFQCYLGVEKLNQGTHRSLSQTLADMGQETVKVREPGGRWPRQKFR